MFDNFLDTVTLDTHSASYQQMLKELQQEYRYLEVDRQNDITSYDEFVPLQEITREFYRNHFEAIYHNYVPLYHSLWKLRLRDVTTIDNLHQDGGVHYFSKNGYQSRMLTIWTNLHKDEITGLNESDMGIYVLDSKDPAHESLYKELSDHDSHFINKRDGQLMDCMYPSGPIVNFDSTAINRTSLAFRPGQSILFNSHLLHGSKQLNKPLDSFSETDKDKFRVSLTSVWLHKEDLNQAVMAMTENDHEDLFLSRLSDEDRELVREYFAEACVDQNRRLVKIKELIRNHESRLKASQAA